MMAAAKTIGELRASGWHDRSVKEELRENLIRRLGGDEDATLFDGIIGYDDTVLPALERAILASHDIIFLGERGQAKTRLIRRLTELLDPEVPVIAGCEINDSPYRPICAGCITRLREEGDTTPIAWLAAERRFAEKLATPDTAVADLLGDIDPIRVAEGRYLTNEEVIHFGLVPRTHRGIFSINELPDLPPRIQVSLLNILEERDVQIRGFTVRLPLDLLLVATANPEDYTNRGRIITPLKDRFGSEIRTHYPDSRADEISIMRQEARLAPAGVELSIPLYLEDIIAEFTQQVRRSPHINQRSGVSVRLSIANLESLAASALRRAMRCGEAEAVPRIADLGALLQSTFGRVEFEGFEEGREAEILRRHLAQAVVEVFREFLGGYDFTNLVDLFADGRTVESGDLVPASAVIDALEDYDPSDLLIRLGLRGESPGDAASAVEFALEGLHLTRRLNKDGTRYGM